MSPKADYINKKANFIRLLAGLCVRLPRHLVFACLRQFARARGAKIGRDVYCTPRILFNANSNLSIGDRSVVCASYLDLRGIIVIGSDVVINGSVEMLSASHDAQIPTYPTTFHTIRIDDYAWVGHGARIVGPAVMKRGAVLGAYSVLRGSLDEQTIAIGNPAKAIKPRKCVHHQLTTERLKGLDLSAFIQLYRDRWLSGRR